MILTTGEKFWSYISMFYDQQCCKVE